MKLFLSMITLLAISLPVQAQHQDGVFARYEGTQDLPDEIAFAEFLKLLGVSRARGSRDHLYMVAEAIGANAEDPRDLTKVKQRDRYFQTCLSEMRTDEFSLRREVLCGSQNDQRGDNEIFDALNAADEIAATTRKKHLVITLNMLDEDERMAFRTYLDELKDGISYIRVDHRVSYTANGAQEPVHLLAQRTCDALQTNLNKLKESRQ